MFFHTSPDALFIPPKTIDPIGYGKVAVVTGCSSGIGLACTQLLLAHQFQVCGLDAREFNYSLLQECDHGRFHFHRADLTEPRACEDGVYASISSFGRRIDLLVNVAGVMDSFSSVDGVTNAEWDRVMAVNLTAPVKMMSTAGLSGAVAGIAYTCSKHGLIGATKNVAWRFRHCHGQGDEFDVEAYAQVEPVHALQTHASGLTPDITPLEVAQAVIYLASDQARTINGPYRFLYYCHPYRGIS
ncbi:Short chain dehydrogenase andC [Colletotrichum fructicola Nara gc5]|uniref:Short chain dehydrogenase andC n=1 Tax=Colletotrichum fructicola (strain Nara gc5) TaxID=1213859 RepID=A0A7J6JLF7_COLFN|nr:Short chain dehydrogenase andC [Colletotrichum fructicola]KAF4490532.1 Short chain dehydrogenase andC [Colletotrichum fructicola Nara gc5]